MASISRWTILAVLLLGPKSTVVAQLSPGPVGADLLLGDPLPPHAIMRLGTMRWRPGGAVQHLAFSPDGKRLASWHNDLYTTDALTIWDVPTGRELRRVELPGLGILSWTWLADGRGISVVQTSEGRFIWEFSDDKTIPPHKRETGGLGFKVMMAGPVVDNQGFSCFAVSPDGKYLAAGKSGALPNKERDIVAWDLATQRRMAGLPAPRRLASAPDSCRDLFYTPDGSKMVVLCVPADRKLELKEYLVSVVDVGTGKQLRRFTTPAPLAQGSRGSLALSNRYLALGMEDEKGTVLLWDLEKGDDRRLATGHGKTSSNSGYGVSALAFTDDGKTLVTAGRDGAVRVWDAATAKQLRTIANAYPAWIEALAVTRDGKRLACAGQYGIIRHWDLTSGAALDAMATHGGRVTGVSVTGDGTLAVTSCDDQGLRLWDMKSGKEKRTITFSPAERWWSQAIMAPDGHTVVVNGETLKAWNVASGKEIGLPELPSDLKAGSVHFADAKTLVAFYAGTVTLLDWPSGKLRRSFTLPKPLQKPGESYCDAATLSPDGRWLATASHGSGADSVLDLWNALTGERVHRLIDGGNHSRTALFTADGDLLYAAGGNLHPRGDGAAVPLKGEFHLIDALTGRLKQTFEPAPRLPGSSHRYSAAMGLAPDGRSIFCSGNDGVIHIYETATGKIRRSLTRHRNSVHALACTADGRRLLTASFDHTALVWDISLSGFHLKDRPAPDPQQQRELWAQLLDPDAKKPYQAMAALAAHPKIAVAVIRAGIKPIASSPTDATLDRLVAELGDSAFTVRERATRELDQLGDLAVAGMRARLAKPQPLETHRRIVRFLDKHDPATVTPAHLRELRALEILEQLDGAESQSVLAELAQGAANARLTRAASAVLARRKLLDRQSER